MMILVLQPFILGRFDPPKAGAPHELLGVWRAALSGTEKLSMRKDSIPRRSAFVLRQDGTYDSESYFIFGRWTYKAPRLTLKPAATGFPGIPQFYQDSATKFAANGKPIVLIMVKGELRLYGDTRYSHAKHWIVFERTHTALRSSARQIARELYDRKPK